MNAHANPAGGGYIVITSIFPPTEAVRAFAQKKDWRLIVAGDKKSPTEWSCEGAHFISADEQEQRDYQVVKVLPWNHYCRKMIGYVEAIRQGAEVIVDTDDDNIPKDDWAMPRFDGEYQTSLANLGFVNIYKSYTDMRIWARGFPLNRITDIATVLDDAQLEAQNVKVGVWQGLADGDPDVDAIYRLTDNTPCYFRKRSAPLVLAHGTLSPFNSQNTAYRRELFPLLYLPSRVTFRFTDILRGLVAQPIMWAANYHLGFTNATVFQERNPHNYLKDFESEIPCYLHPERIIDVVTGCVSSGASIADNLHRAYKALEDSQITTKHEMPILEAWLEDVAIGQARKPQCSA